MEIASETVPGIRYTLERIGDRWQCDCPGYTRWKHCKHARQMQQLERLARSRSGSTYRIERGAA